MISVKSLSKRYGALQAVSDLSFEVGRGDILGLLGHNGAGKTTVMKILTGFLEPTAGSAEVGGKDVRTQRVDVQRLIGYLPESAPLYPEMLVQEYLQMMCELRGIPVAERQKAISYAVHATGLEGRLVQRIGTLSKGFRQRVGLAQAILHRPDVLVLDEPTNGLDPVQIVEIRELIKRLAKDTTIILSTHILPEIEAVCNRVVILIDGHLAADSTLEDLLKSDDVRVAVAKGTDDVVGVLRGVVGVDSVKPDGSTPDGYDRYRVKVSGSDVRPRIVEAATAAGWTLAEVAPLMPSLERVFRDLNEEHVSRARGGEAAA